MYDYLNSKIPYVIVSGGSSGLGLSISEALIENGFGVVSISPNASSYKVRYNNFIPLDCDAANEINMARELERLAKENISVTAIINNAGKSQWSPIEKLNNQFVEEMFKRNVYTTVTTVQTVLKTFSGITSIVNISSLAGKRGTPNNSIYVAAKFAINGLTNAWCKELGPQGIRVNAICPVLIKTPGLLAEI